MNLDDFKDRIREQLGALWGRISESTLFNSLKEQFDTWPPIAQRAAGFGSGVVAILLILSIPFSYINSASSSVEEFDEYRGLIRELRRVSHSANEPPPLPPGQSSNELQAQTQKVLAEFSLVPEQLAGITALGDKPAGGLAPDLIAQAGVAVSLKKLNLLQILDIGHRLQSLAPGTKMTGLQITANAEDNHYYDVVFKVVNFSLPFSGDTGGPGGSGGQEDTGR